MQKTRVTPLLNYDLEGRTLKTQRLIDSPMHKDDLSMCTNPCRAQPPYQLTFHRSQPKASVISVLKAQINVPSVAELSGLNVEILAINDRHNAVTKNVKYALLRETKRLR